MAKVQAKHAKPKTIKSLEGRTINDAPKSLLDRPQPSDDPTVILEEEIVKPNVNVDDNPGTTVLGMDNEASEAPEVEEKPVKKEKPKAAKPKKPAAQKKTTTPRTSKLVLVRKFNGEVVKITKRDFVIGKSKYSDYQVTKNNTVSRSHVIAHKQTDGSLTVEDNGSKNGTFVDGERLESGKEVKLKAGQSLRLSDEIFDVQKA